MKLNHILRKLWKNKFFTILNIVGLAIGISACWIVFKIVSYEFSFDKPNPAREQIYKVYSKYEYNNEVNSFDGTPAPLWDYVKNNLSQVELSIPMFNRYFEKITINPNSNDKAEYNENERIYSTNPDYFKMVKYQWLAGNEKQALNSIDKVVLTASRAKIYFPNLKPNEIIGKQILYDTTLYAVSGIVEDLNYPSTFTAKEFQLVKDSEWRDQSWASSNSNNHLYIKINNEKDIAPVLLHLKNKLMQLTEKEWSEYNVKGEFQLAKLSEAHFNTILSNSTNKNVVYGMIGIGLFLLLLASINYINLSTALIPQRAKEIGIRKTLGQQGKQVTVNFFLETLMITSASLLLSWPLTRLFERFFSHYLPSDLENFSHAGWIFLFLLALLLLITLFSSIYPTYLINKVQIIDVLKVNKNAKLSFGNISVRKALIVFQFIIAQVFVIATFIIGFQMKHMLSSDLGFNKNALLTLSLPYKEEDGKKNPIIFKEILSKHPEIQKAALGHFPLSNDHWGNFVNRSSDTGLVKVNMPFKLVGDSYFDVYEFKLLAGRTLELSDTSTGIILNEKAIYDLGYKSPQEAIGQEVSAWDKNRKITGVVGNFHSKSMHVALEPVSFLASNKRGQLQKIAIKLNNDPSTWKASIEIVQREWEKYYPATDFSYEFYDDRIKELYEKENRFSKIINLSSGITILISCLGLVGLVTITTAQRTKEIGVRKVLGSTVGGIIRLLSKDYIKLILISIVIATPIAWWAMNQWLTDFAFKIELSWWMFSIPAVATLLISFITMGVQSLKAARANPVDSLRDE